MCPSREAKGEALTGVRAGCRWAIAAKSPFRGPTVWDATGRQQEEARHPRVPLPGAVVGGGMHVRTMRGSREPSFTPEVRVSGRKGKPKGAIRRCT